MPGSLLCITLFRMRQSTISVTRKKRGRPATGQDPVRTIRLSNEVWAEIGAWAERRKDKPSQSVAIRMLILRGLKRR